MIAFKDQMISVKLTIIIMSVTLSTLLLAGIGLSLYEAHHVKSDMGRELHTIATLISSRSTAALIFDDAAMTMEDLQSLKESPNIELACIYGNEKRLFASYYSDEGNARCPDITLMSTNADMRFDDDHIALLMPIKVADDFVGTLFLRSSMAPVTQRTNDFIYAISLAMLLASLMAYLLTRRLQVFISKPLQELTKTTHAVKESSNFSLRVSVDTEDELGQLSESFNAMLVMMENMTAASKAGNEILGKLAAFPEYSPMMVLSITHEGEIDYVNKAARDFLKRHDKNEIEILLFLPDNLNELLEKCYSENHEITDVEVNAYGHCLLWTFSPVASQKIVHLYAKDITSLKQAQADTNKVVVEKLAAEAASQEKSFFLANMSHEIRTPLTAIIGFSGILLEKDSVMEERVHATHAIIRSAKHLRTIINNILDISKVEAGDLDVECIESDLFDIIDDVKSITELAAEEKGLEFAVDYRFPLPATFLTDPVRLKQILINLCNNAIKFTQQGKVSLNVVYDKDKATLTIDIIDTGIGITEAQLGKLFIPFSQADITTTRTYGGTGLGLHLSKQLAQILGGDISVTSISGKGSSFCLGLPLEDSGVTTWAYEVPEKESIDSFVDPSRYTLQGIVLLAEDNKENQILISHYLTKAGITVEIANNGQKAVEMAAKKTYDLILMDMQMPVMGGIEAIETLRANNYTKPIFSLTANSTPSDVKLSSAAGSDGFLTKPIDRVEFFTVLAEHLAQGSDEVEDKTPIYSSLVDDAPTMEPLVCKFIKKIPIMLDEIELNYAKKDWEAVKFGLHNLKGVSGNYGYAAMSAHVAKMEFTAVNQASEDFDVLFVALKKLYQRMVAALDAAMLAEAEAAE